MMISPNPLEQQIEPKSRGSSQKRSWKMKVIEGLGLKNFLIRTFVYRPPQPGYIFEEGASLKFVPIFQNKKYDVYSPYLNIEAYILHSSQSSKQCYVPMVYLSRPQVIQQNRSPSVSASQSISRYNNTSQAAQIESNFNNFFRQNRVHRSKSLIEIRSMMRKQKKNKPTKKRKQRSSKKRDNQQNESLNQSQCRVRQNAPYQSKLLVIYSHGNASDLGDVYFFSERLVKEYDVDMLIYDYTGYGIGFSKYEINEKQTYSDLQDVLSFAVCQLNYQLNQIVLWGFSLGSGPTTEIASRFSSLGGVILQAPLASLVLWLETNRTELSAEEKDIYCNINKIHAIKSKIMLIHGDKDTIINIRHSQLLYEKYIQKNKDPNNIWFITVANQNHNDLQEVIENADCDLGKKLFRFFREIDMERACYQLSNNSHFHPEWPPEEIQRMKVQEEIMSRETVLLYLLADDYKFTKTRVESNPPKHKQQSGSSQQQQCQIKPIDDLFESTRIHRQKTMTQSRIYDYATMINQTGSFKSNQTSTSGTFDLPRTKTFKYCFCSRVQDT